ncbi:mitochondrial transcription rescue factor 1 [Ischnura elegans]|uniref:mitochondrial transcription rescue factor 1 n=1 Tax=Ischnura elegans TaxID=197161 RepID=UPI001ED8A4CA|nr:mitochondrial transcription rescue factor 1 [Ischnura elegans]
MNLIIHCGPTLKCLLSRARPYYPIMKVFGDIQCKTDHKRCYPSRKLFSLSLSKCEPIIPSYHLVKRNKYTKKAEEENSDAEDEVDVIEDVGKDFKVVKIRVNSLRADLVLKAALGMARNKVEAAFFQSKIRVNGAVLTKKSSQLRMEDEIDLVRGTSKLNPGFLVVSRVKLLSYSEKDDKVIVNAQCFKSLTIENYSEHPWKRSE